MKLLVISSAPIVELNGKLHLYAPYEKEMQLWAKYADAIQFCCPIWREDKKLLIAPISFKVDTIVALQEFDITSFSNKLKAIPLAFLALVKIFKAMKQADHIHLRCPGNIALLACLVQILFPNKQKTAKYAGNWDPKSQQPWSYRLQKWILSNPFLTRNMQVLVYGEWEGSSTNIKSFFTATYSEEEIGRLGDWEIGRLGDGETRRLGDWEIGRLGDEETRRWGDGVTGRRGDGVKFLFVGTLSPGKQPLYAIQLVEEFHKKGKKVALELYGEGVLRKELELYIAQNNLESIVTLKGNQTKETVLKGYQNSHFLILPSKSEGWPKVVAEAMFWGCVPIASPVSCVPFMMGNGSRGIVLKEQLHNDISQIMNVLNNQEVYKKMALDGQTWSRQFTTDKFEIEIKKLLRN
ncbi:MAG: glycosyltransferase [Flavobacterium sp.]|uniref:glycosyltransferase n=1 Tax=Flavobacterium sp. TaxID=239 RepID=UPI0025C28574|nr:glycosyltransferase [Flavobacterium sp.]MCA1966142.1 glycosyltransferase [Flavobacterium sp.]